MADQAVEDQMEANEVEGNQVEEAQIEADQVEVNLIENENINLRSRSCEQRIGPIFHVVFHIFCFISGQLMLDSKKYNQTTLVWKVFKIVIVLLMFPLFVIFFALNIGSVVFDLYAVIKCPFPNCGFIAGPYFFLKHFYSLNITNGSTSYKIYPEESENHMSFEHAVITVATISGSLSYLIIICVLVTNYSVAHPLFDGLSKSFIPWFKTTLKLEDIDNGRNAEITSLKILSPFLNGKIDPRDRNIKFIPVYLYAKHLFCFYFFFFLNLLVYASNVALLFIIVKKEADDNYPTYELIDYFGLAAQLSSQYCAIISCFIFSKVAYAITIRCHKMLEQYERIIPEPIPENFDVDGILLELENKDTEYVKLCNDSMRPYRFWFSVHWFLYALTGFMSIAYFVETVLTHGHPYLNIIYIFLFTLEHLVLFLYPCFRAASILEARNTLIYRVSQKAWPTSIKSPFLQFMKEQRCGFIMSLVCIRVEFGFNIAYVSIFIGFLGIVFRFFSLF